MGADSTPPPHYPIQVVKELRRAEGGSINPQKAGSFDPIWQGWGQIPPPPPHYPIQVVKELRRAEGGSIYPQKAGSFDPICQGWGQIPPPPPPPHYPIQVVKELRRAEGGSIYPQKAGSFDPIWQGWGQIHPPPPITPSRLSRSSGEQKVGLLTHSEWRPQNIYSLEEKKPILLSNWHHKFLYFHYKSVKLDVCLDKIKYEHLSFLSNLKSCQFVHPE